MNLDPKILPGKRPLTCFDTEQAEKYIGKLCYICDEYDYFHALALIKPTILKGVEDCEVPFQYGSDRQAEFCLPCEWVKEEKSEPKYRPYKDVQEFFNDIGCSVGDVIHYRRKSDNTRYRSIIVGTSRKDGYELVFFCNEWYTMKELFDLCEVFTSGDWKPFGIEEQV